MNGNASFSKIKKNDLCTHVAILKTKFLCGNYRQIATSGLTLMKIDNRVAS